MGNSESVDSEYTCLLAFATTFAKAHLVPSPSPQRIFAANVRRLRVASGLSQEALAERAGLHRTYVSSIERAERNVSLQNIFALAEALGVAPEVLVATAPKSGSK